MKLTKIKSLNSQLFIIDYENEVLAEAMTIKQLKEKIKTHDVQLKLQARNLEPNECVWIWTPSLNNTFILEFIKHNVIIRDSKQKALAFISPKLLEKTLEIESKNNKVRHIQIKKSATLK